MQIHIFTLFPKMFGGPFGESIIRRAVARGLLTIHLHNFREYTHDRHRTVDDYQYGGGPGMLLKPEPLFEAVESVVGAPAACPVVLLTPQGKLFSQAHAKRLSAEPTIAVISGHYGGVDERIRQHLATEEISIGDYVLSGGELAAMVVVDAIVRLLPGVLGAEESAEEDSHATGLLQHPQYTRPAQFRDWPVPEVLLSGDHQAVALWRRQRALLRTWQRRPDIFTDAALTEKERRWLHDLRDREE
jgi:tRNA (guanine37-N1)-methyltransferase